MTKMKARTQFAFALFQDDLHDPTFNLGDLAIDLTRQRQRVRDGQAAFTYRPLTRDESARANKPSGTVLLGIRIAPDHAVWCLIGGTDTAMPADDESKRQVARTGNRPARSSAKRKVASRRRKTKPA